jgi:DNA-binding MarR family transcriptional regulator
MRNALNRVLELTVVLNNDMTRDLERRGLTGSRAHLVWELNSRGPSTQQALADAFGVTPRAITGLVDALATSGFVTRQPHPADRRATLVTFTKHGERTAKALERDHVRLARQLFDGMSETTFRSFTRGLDTVLARLHEMLGEAESRRDPVRPKDTGARTAEQPGTGVPRVQFSNYP